MLFNFSCSVRDVAHDVEGAAGQDIVAHASHASELVCAVCGFPCRGVEARVPFLDRNFLDIAMAIDPSEKMIDKSQGEPKLQQWWFYESSTEARVARHTVSGTHACSTMD
jgi:hypothetical protein